MDSKLDGKPGPRIAAALVTGFFLIAAFPLPFFPLGTEIDPSWQYGINALVDSPYEHGRDVVFPYGPLGHLLVPMDVGNNLILGLVAWLAVHAALTVLLARRAMGIAGVMPAAAFTFAFLVAVGLGMPFEYRVLVLVGLLVVESLEGTRNAWVPAALAGALSATAVFGKFSLGVSTVVALVVGEVMRPFVRRPWQALDALGAAGGFAIALAVVTLSSFGSVESFTHWLGAELQLAGGFSTAMSLPARLPGLFMGWAALAAYATLLVLLRRHVSAALAALVFALPVLIAFKHGFVRQGTHVTNFFGFTAAALGAVLACCRGARAMRITAGTLAVVVLLAIGTYAQAGRFRVAALARSLTGLEGLSNAMDAVRFARTRDRLAEIGTSSLEKARLPEPWLRTISGGRVGVFPSEISYIAANDLEWVPGYVPQSYSAYSVDLDGGVADRLASSSGPDFVLFEFEDIDLRHPLIGSPATVRALLTHYVPADGLPDRGLLLLQRTAPRFRYPVGASPEAEGALGEWVEVPESDVLLFAELHFHMTLRGRADKLLFRIDPVSMEVQYATGSADVFRILPSTSASGIVINYLPRSLDALAGLMLGRAGDRVARFRIGGSGALAYRPTFGVVWRESDYDVEYDVPGVPVASSPSD